MLETLDDTTDVFYYETQSVAPLVKRDFVILRSWRRNLSGGSCGTVWTSIDHRGAPPVSGVRGTILACRCLIEPIGLGRSRMTYITRMDLRWEHLHLWTKLSDGFGKIQFRDLITRRFWSLKVLKNLSEGKFFSNARSIIYFFGLSALGQIWMYFVGLLDLSNIHKQLS